MTLPDYRTPPIIAIIGGGFSGSMVATQLLRLATFPLTIKLIEPRPELGQGVAYSTANHCHLLNVPAGRMSAFPDDPRHFLDWLQAHGEYPYKADSFVPRQFYGAYVQAVLQKAHEKALQFVHLEWINDAAIAVLPERRRGIIHLQSGKTLYADRIVLAPGNFPPGDPVAVDRSFYRSQRYSSNPWSADACNPLTPQESVVMIGSGLTLVDLVLTLKERCHQGTIHVISRHGLLPHRHQSSTPYTPFLTVADASKTIHTLLRRVRQEVKQAALQGYDWRPVIDSLRPLTQVLWRALAIEEKQRFLRHLRPYWEIHRHRTAPEVAEAITRMQQSQQLLIHAGCIQACHEQADGVAVLYRPRHSSESRTLQVSRVINCTGPECDYRQLQHPLIVNLLRAGLIRPDPLALGLDVNPAGALVNAAGVASSLLYMLGPPRKGCLWETTAVPEIREQAKAMAQYLLYNFEYQQAVVFPQTEGIV